MTNGTWETSPFTDKQSVLVEHDDQGNKSKYDIESGFFTNEYPLNYIKYPDENLTGQDGYEARLPELIKNLRHDDGESYWYPIVVEASDGIVFPLGTLQSWEWCYAPVIDNESTSEADMKNAKYYKRHLDAIKNINGYSLGDISFEQQTLINTDDEPIN